MAVVKTPVGMVIEPEAHEASQDVCQTPASAMIMIPPGVIPLSMEGSNKPGHNNK